MMKHNFKTIIAFLLLFAMVTVAFTGCDEAPGNTADGTSEPTSTATPIPTVLTKDEAKPLFIKAFEDTFAAKSMTFSINYKEHQKAVNGDKEDEYTRTDKTSGMIVTDADGKVKAYFNNDLDQYGNKIQQERYYMNGRIYRYENGEVGKDEITASVNIGSFISRYINFTDSYDNLIKGAFDERFADCIAINGRSINVSVNDFVEFARMFGGDLVSESELEEMKQMVASFSFTFNCTLSDDGYISSMGYNMQMDAAQNGTTANQNVSFELTLSQVNKTEDKGLPTWLDGYLKNPENFADKIGRDENGKITWYEVDTLEDGVKVETVRYNADGSVDSYRKYTYDDKRRTLTDIEYSANGTEQKKTVFKYEDGENGETVSITESYYENGELKTVSVANFVDESLNGMTYYENGVPVRKESANGDTTYYYYKGNGDLFCYWVDYRLDSDKYFDAKGNELTFHEYHELTYFDEEYDDKGRCIKKTEYNVDKQVQSIITLTYYENGKLASELKTDKNSNKIWEKTYYENGSIKEDVEYSDNQYVIKNVKSYSEDGKLLTHNEYNNDGEILIYHYNGKEQYTKIERFGANDKLLYSADYDEKGRIAKEFIYNTDGSLKSYNTREYYSEINCIITFYDAEGNELSKFDTANGGSGG